MKKILLVATLMQVALSSAMAQGHGFKFGQFSYDELNMKTYAQDSSAAAVVLNEFGEGYINEYEHLMYEYHVKIKILKQEGLDEANFSLPMYKTSRLISLDASTFNIVKGSAVETKFQRKELINDRVTKNWTYKKVALANVVVGSVIEIMAKFELPSSSKDNFIPWDFQSDLPKMQSEYWATIPANYVYNITLKGPLQLSLKETTRVTNCWLVAAGTSDCIQYKFGMKNIPAFVEEDYMTAASNFMSSIHFELSELKYFEGDSKKFAQEWKDVDEYLRRHEDFGLQIKRGKGVLDTKVDEVILGATDDLSKAKKIYDFIKEWFTWDEYYGKYCRNGIAKAFEKKSGNVADINLALVAALKYAGISANALILSTRENGLPIEVHPVETDFNYVIAKVDIGDKVYLLDATEDYYPFGVLPIRCVNGKGRVMNGEADSYWHELKPTDREKEISMLNVKIQEDGSMIGTLDKTYIGYAAVEKRKEIKTFTTQKAYIEEFDKGWAAGTVKNFVIENVDDITKPVVEKLQVEIEGSDNVNGQLIYFNPFILEKLEENPFKSKQRIYPVDYGSPIDQVLIFNFELPANLEVVEMPTKVGLALPNGGGRYIFDPQANAGKISITNSFSVAKPVFAPEEYHFLKELYDRRIQVQKADIVLELKSK